MGRSQRHLRYNKGLDSSGMTPYEFNETSLRSVTQQYNDSLAAGGKPPPANTVLPTISGTTTEGETLTCANGTWLGSPSYTYQWLRNGVAIVGETASTLVLATADVGARMSCQVKGTNANGSEIATTAQTAAIAGL